MDVGAQLLLRQHAIPDTQLLDNAVEVLDAVDVRGGGVLVKESRCTPRGVETSTSAVLLSPDDERAAVGDARTLCTLHAPSEASVDVEIRGARLAFPRHGYVVECSVRRADTRTPVRTCFRSHAEDVSKVFNHQRVLVPFVLHHADSKVGVVEDQE